MPRLPNDNPRGYMTLLSVLMISAIAVSAAVSVALLGSDRAALSYNLGVMAQARGFADACSEIALQAIATDPNYADSFSNDFEVDDEYVGQCTYTVLAGTGDGGQEQRIIQATGVNFSSARNLIIVAVSPVETYPIPKIISWERVAAFDEES